MSYNITSWKTLAHNDFKIPLSVIKALSESEARSEGFYINKKEPEYFLNDLESPTEIDVTDFCNYGQFSGGFQNDLIKALKETKGHYRGRIVWEGGDTIEIIEVINGNVQTVSI